jgi:TolA-binding protein
MANRCEEEFNPWPSFVDIFSSVILVMLLFLLVLLVNLGYYAQFKYKVSYTGSISSNELQTQSASRSTVDTTIKKKVEAKNLQQQKQIVQMKQQIQKLKQKIQKDKVVIARKNKTLESAGLDIAKKTDENRDTKQKVIQTDDYFVVTFKASELFIDDAIIKKIKKFISNAKEKNGIKKVYISAFDPKNQVSATIAKQISLSRSIGTRNMIRKLGFNKKDVRIDLRDKTKIKENIDKQNGYLVIRIKK